MVPAAIVILIAVGALIWLAVWLFVRDLNRTDDQKTTSVRVDSELKKSAERLDKLEESIRRLLVHLDQLEHPPKKQK